MTQPLNMKRAIATSGACAALAAALLAATPARADPISIGTMIVGLVSSAAGSIGATISVSGVVGSLITTAIGRGLYLGRRS